MKKKGKKTDEIDRPALSVNSMRDNMTKDIAERKKAEAELKESESCYRVLFDQASDYILVLEADRDGSLIITDANEAALRGHGYERSEMVGQPITLLDPDLSAETIAERISDITNKGNLFFNARHRKKDGSLIEVEVHTRQVNIAGRQFLLSLERDVTERRRAEEELIHERNKAQQYLDTVETIIVSLDTRGCITMINRKGCELLGYKEEELIGKNWFKTCLPQPDGTELVYPYFLQLTSGRSEITEYFENAVVTRYGNERLIAWHNALLKNDKGAITGTLSSGDDITERKKAEGELRKSEEKYRRIIENLRTDYFFYSHDTNGVFTYLSPSITNILGYSPDEFLTHYTEYLTDDPVNREVERNTEQSMKGILQEPYEVEIYHKNGSIRWLSVTEVPMFDDAGKVIAVEGIAHDITSGKIADEQKRTLEEHLRQSQKIEAVGILAGGIAHDFNNILNAIMGFTYLARLKTPEDSAAAGYLNNLTEATNRAVELVKQVLAFSRKGAGELQPIIITPVVKEALKMLRASIPTTIEIRQHIVSAKYILGDPTHIHQIIMNLCTNAYHAMQDTGGVMEVRVEDIDVGPDLKSLIADIKQGPHVRLTVSDTGQGIDPSIIDKIFDPYFTTKGMGKGTGLGLSVVHGIVKQCGGSITVSSEFNNGASFQVFFPVVHLEARRESKTGEALMRGTETVLVVDDEESIVMITGEILKELGYNVVSSTDSEEALRLFREEPGRFDVVFTDMTMPRMTGLQLSNAILGIRPDVPIVLSTGYSEGINEEIVIKSGIRKLLIKPISPEKLSQAIRKALEK